MATETTPLVVDPDTTRPDLADALAFLNQDAKNIRRKGYTGTASVAYALQHDRINAVLDAWQDAKG